MQTTLANKAAVSGRGLDTGMPVQVVLRPATQDSGIRFRRVDLATRENIIPGRYDAVVGTEGRTVIQNAAGVRLSLVEHAMAAFLACGVDNLEVDVNGPELPILDGSSHAWAVAVHGAGLTGVGGRRQAIRILDRISFGNDSGWVALEPSSAFEIAFDIEFREAAIGNQSLDLRILNGEAVTEILPARTFGSLTDVTRRRQLGGLRGGTLESGVLIDGMQILSPGGLRYADEFVRHKMLDGLGDLYLGGRPVLGRFTGYCPGHALTNGLVHKVFETPNSWTLEDVAMPECVPSPPALPDLTMRTSAAS